MLRVLGMVGMLVLHASSTRCGRRAQCPCQAQGTTWGDRRVNSSRPTPHRDVVSSCGVSDGVALCGCPSFRRRRRAGSDSTRCTKESNAVESAYRIQDPDNPSVGPRESITIWLYRHPGPDQALARSWHYICERCSCRMFPVFPEIEKAGRRNSSSPHFRAGKKDPHREGCTEHRDDSAGTAEGAVEGRARRASAPSRFIDEPQRASGGSRRSATGEADGDADVETRGRKRTAPGDKRSIASVRTLRALATCWHEDVEAMRDVSLQVPGCPGQTYGTVFCPVDAALGSDMHPAGERYVMWSDAMSVMRETSGAYRVTFPVHTRHRKQLIARIHTELSGQPLSDSLVARLESAAEGAPMTIYLLGGFQYDRTTDCFLLTPLSERHIWLEQGRPNAGGNRAGAA